MRKIILLLLSAFIAAPAFADRAWLTEAQIAELAGDNFAALSEACDGNFYKPTKTLLKSELSGHIPRGDWRRHDSDDGSCSLIGGGIGRSTVLNMTGRQRNINFLALNAEKIGTFRRYDIFGKIYKFRYYTTNNICRAVQTKAQQKTGKKTGCVRWANGCSCTSAIVGRTGGVK